MLLLATWEALWRFDHRQFWWVFGIGVAGLMASRRPPCTSRWHEHAARPGRGIGWRNWDASTHLNFCVRPLIWSLIVWFAGVHGLIETNTANAQQVAWHLAAIAGSVALFELAGRAMHWTALRRTQVLLTVGALAVLPVLIHPLREGAGLGVAGGFACRGGRCAGGTTASRARRCAACCVINLLVVLAGWELCWRAVDAHMSDRGE